MAQKAETNYQDEYQTNYSSSKDQSAWIWGGLIALAVLGLAVWFMASGGPTTSTVNTSPPPAEQIAPAPDATAPVAPAPDAAAPAQDAAPAPAPAPAPAQ